METAKAIVAHEPQEGQGPGGNWTYEDIDVPTAKLGSGELLIQMVASGICHTDVLMTASPPGSGVTYPIVAGHEGSGIVKAIGPGVTKKLAVGDPVLLSFAFCESCDSCTAGHPAYCHNFLALNLLGVPDVFGAAKGEAGGGGVAGKFFGHSSFAALSVVKETCVLPAKDLVRNDDELKLFAPLGCGIQTGTGAILNIVKAGPDDRVMVLGLGGVGLGAVMGAIIGGCKQIIAVDLFDSRIELAKSFGATHGLNSKGLEDYKSAFEKITDGHGPTVVVDTTAFAPIFEAGYQSLAPGGAFVFIGASGNPEASFNINIQQLMLKGTKVFGCIEGDSVPMEFIPRLIQAHRDGKLPIDKFIKFYKAADFKTALHDMHAGETIKPVLLW